MNALFVGITEWDASYLLTSLGSDLTHEMELKCIRGMQKVLKMIIPMILVQTKPKVSPVPCAPNGQDVATCQLQVYQHLPQDRNKQISGQEAR